MKIMPPSFLNPELTIEWLRANATGAGVEVAVIDSGIDVTHPKLAGKVKQACRVTNTAGPVCAAEIHLAESHDVFGHGTGVAGIICDIAPDAEIINIEVLNQYNNSTGENLLAGLSWALEKKIKLINMSVATIKKELTIPLFELCEQAYSQDTILVVSRRNSGPVGWPALFSSVISVEIGNFYEKFKTIYKNANLIECDGCGSKVRVAMPGARYALQTGTSFATPHVTGIVALMLQIWPTLLPVEAKTLIKAISDAV